MIEAARSRISPSAPRAASARHGRELRTPHARSPNQRNRRGLRHRLHRGRLEAPGERRSATRTSHVHCTILAGRPLGPHPTTAARTVRSCWTYALGHAVRSSILPGGRAGKAQRHTDVVREARAQAELPRRDRRVQRAQWRGWPSVRETVAGSFGALGHCPPRSPSPPTPTLLPRPAPPASSSLNPSPRPRTTGNLLRRARLAPARPATRTASGAVRRGAVGRLRCGAARGFAAGDHPRVGRGTLAYKNSSMQGYQCGSRSDP